MTPPAGRRGVAKGGASEGPGGCGCAAPRTDAADTCYCTVEEIVDVISRKHSLSVLNYVGSRGSVRFGDVQAGLSGISSSTLSETLRHLTRAGLLERTAHAEAPPRVEYATTGAGETLRRRLHELLDRIHSGGGDGAD